MQTKQQIWEFLSSNPAYQEAMSEVGPEEREKIESFVRGRCVDLIHRTNELLSSVPSDPEAKDKLGKALSGG